MFLLNLLLLWPVHGGDRSHGPDGPHSRHGAHGEVAHGRTEASPVAHRTSGTEKEKSAGLVIEVSSNIGLDLAGVDLVAI